jgi:integral membrane protein
MISEKSKQIYVLRITGIAEGISYLLLLGIAMPLKYFFGLPEAVKYPGAIHGFLFIVYTLAALRCILFLKWSFWWNICVLGASLIPFGPFLLESKLKKAQVLFKAEEEAAF